MTAKLAKCPKAERCSLCGQVPFNLRGRSECVNPVCELYGLPMQRVWWNRLHMNIRALAKGKVVATGYWREDCGSTRLCPHNHGCSNVPGCHRVEVRVVEEG